MTDQPWIDEWPMFEEAYSKFPVLADVEAARVKLARKYNSKGLPKHIEIELSWREHEHLQRRARRNA
jgi:hypothetical protein